MHTPTRSKLFGPSAYAARCLIAVLSTMTSSVLFGRSSLNEHIAVSSTAAPDYRRESDTKRQETYVFMEGQNFGSGTRDRGLEATTFTTLTSTLAKDLVKQNYYPTKDVGTADLVIMVHWGATRIFEDGLQDQMIGTVGGLILNLDEKESVQGISRPAFETGLINHISDALDWSAGNSESLLQRNAALIGYKQSLDKFAQSGGFATEKEKTLRLELSEERYFVVLMAYDNRALRNEKQKRLRWVTRLSVRTPGNNFAEALPAMSLTGSHVYGHDVKGLVHVKANLRETRIDLGELKVLEAQESNPAAKPEEQPTRH